MLSGFDSGHHDGRPPRGRRQAEAVGHASLGDAREPKQHDVCSGCRARSLGTPFDIQESSEPPPWRRGTARLPGQLRRFLTRCGRVSGCAIASEDQIMAVLTLEQIGVTKEADASTSLRHGRRGGNFLDTRKSVDPYRGHTGNSYLRSNLNSPRNSAGASMPEYSSRIRVQSFNCC
jgi:hypothetical protein